MKVLFLDIDGALNSTRTAIAFDGYPWRLDQMEKFDPVALALVRRLCQQTDSVVCMSSSWRSAYTEHEFSNAFALPVIGRTPHIAGPRGSEIAAWLSTRDDVTQYAIVDDDVDMLPEQMPYFVKTSGANGLSFYDYEALRRILEGEQ